MIESGPVVLRGCKQERVLMQSGVRGLLGVVETFHALIVVMVTQLYTFVKMSLDLLDTKWWILVHAKYPSTKDTKKKKCDFKSSEKHVKAYFPSLFPGNVTWRRSGNLTFLTNAFFFLFRATPAAFGSSQARGPIRAAAADLYHSHSNTRSLAHWARPGIESTSLWLLVESVTAEPHRELHKNSFWKWKEMT